MATPSMLLPPAPLLSASAAGDCKHVSVGEAVSAGEWKHVTGEAVAAVNGSTSA